MEEHASVWTGNDARVLELAVEELADDEPVLEDAAAEGIELHGSLRRLSARRVGRTAESKRPVAASVGSPGWGWLFGWRRDSVVARRERFRAALVLTLDGLRAALPEEIEVQSQIYLGGQRHVYEVSVGGERRVLKLMPEGARERAEREVKIGRNFDHPNLSKIADDELRDVEVDGEIFGRRGAEPPRRP